jgi:N-acetylmuramoyl-L-alanine amidase
VNAISQIATMSPHGLRQDLPVRPVSAGRQALPFGLAVHTTGRGLATALLKKLGRMPNAQEVLALALRTYAAGFGPGYVGGLGGELYQVAADDRVAQHIGGSREEYLSGSWKLVTKQRAVDHWQRAWPAYDSPQHLFPGKSANEAYIGLELIPVTGVSGVVPVSPGETFTAAQYELVRSLCADLEVRHSWPAGWRRSARLVGHEDVGILDRHDAGGGWDPGALRDEPRWRWERVR